MILVRRLLGDVLRGRRQRSGRTLRQLAATARVSPGYLSEVERGQKEPSSELLAAICDALEVKLSDVLLELSTELAAAELAAEIEAAELGRLVPADGRTPQRVAMPPGAQRPGRRRGPARGRLRPALRTAARCRGRRGCRRPARGPHAPDREDPDRGDQLPERRQPARQHAAGLRLAAGRAQIRCGTPGCARHRHGRHRPRPGAGTAAPDGSAALRPGLAVARSGQPLHVRHAAAALADRPVIIRCRRAAMTCHHRGGESVSPRLAAS